jgi:hypothetical protein
MARSVTFADETTSASHDSPLGRRRILCRRTILQKPHAVTFSAPRP